MKLAARQIEGFLSAPPPGCLGVLLYGPDEGVQRDRLNRLLAAKQVDRADPFAFMLFEADRLLQDPGLLGSELCALSFALSPRALCVSGATDKCTALLKEAVALPHPAAFLIVLAGELTPRSSLRGFAESAEHFAAVPCYAETGEQLEHWLRQSLRAHGLEAEPGVIEAASRALEGGGRALAQRFIETLRLYLGDDTRVTHEVLRALSTTQVEEDFAPLVDAVASGDTKRTDIEYSKLIDGGGNPVAAIRALQNYLYRLLDASQRMQGGMSADQAIESLRPPVFFRLAPQMRAQLLRNSLPALVRASERLLHLEQLAKGEYRSAVTQTHRALLGLAQSLRGR